MSTTEARTEGKTGGPAVTVDMKLEVVVIPVGDIERSKQFYTGLGWRLDADYVFDGGWRIVQVTPPGSGSSIQFGTELSALTPGSVQGLYLVVSDIEAARQELLAHGVEVGEAFHESAPGGRFHEADRAAGPSPEGTYRTFATFSDPDGNGWLLQEITTRLPGRLDPSTTTYSSVNDVMSALIRAATAHGEHEKRTGEADPEWPAWYAAYMVAEQAGTELPQ